MDGVEMGGGGQTRPVNRFTIYQFTVIKRERTGPLQFTERNYYAKRGLYKNRNPGVFVKHLSRDGGVSGRFAEKQRFKHD